MNEYAIRTNQIHKEFKTVTAVDNLSLEIPPGTIFGFLGPNGSGKTTTIRLLLGLLEPTRGSAEILGHDTRTDSEAIREKCGALLEQTGLYERLDAQDNLEFYARAWQMDRAERNARIHELLDELGLWERRNEPVGTWSRGMKQKLAVARVMLHRPEIIFLDEPTAGLDPVAAAALNQDLSNLAQQNGVTVFLTTHNLAEAEKLCSLVGVIRQGKLLRVGKPDELRAHTGKPHAEVFGSGFTPHLIAGLRSQPQIESVMEKNSHLELILRGDQEIAPLVAWMVSEGAQIEEIRRGQSSLEEVFITLMQEDNHGE
jgi:ABC-2 type transport system ATP-binding protein